jgi:hypothetical protein
MVDRSIFLREEAGVQKFSKNLRTTSKVWGQTDDIKQLRTTLKTYKYEALPYKV